MTEVRGQVLPYIEGSMVKRLRLGLSDEDTDIIPKHITTLGLVKAPSDVE